MRYALLFVSLYASQLHAGQSERELSLIYGSPFSPQYEILEFAQHLPTQHCAFKTIECKTEDLPGVIKSVSSIPFAVGALLGCMSYYNETIINHLAIPIACSICSSTICYLTADYCPKKTKCSVWTCVPNCLSNDTPEQLAPIEYEIPE